MTPAPHRAGRAPARRAATALAAVAALVTLVAACTSSAATSKSQQTQQPQRQQPTSPSAYYDQHLAWHACDNGFQCAPLQVPFNYQDPNGRRFSLPVIKLAASDPKDRIGAPPSRTTPYAAPCQGSS